MKPTLAQAWKHLKRHARDVGPVDGPPELLAEMTFIAGAHWVLGQLGKELSRDGGPAAMTRAGELLREADERLRQIENWDTPQP